MNKVKCECGHVNPEGTVLCEACGKPIEGNQHIDGNEGNKLLNMRYDGTARRSQTYNKSIIDKIWSFFSSVKVGVWLIVIALVASMVGTIFPQEIYIPADAVSRDPAIFYEDRYGILGLIYYQLGFHNLYSSWWYMVLIALIGISLVICSLDRFVPLYKALKRQKAKRHETFLNRQRLYSESEQVTPDDIETVKENLKKQRYKITDENGHILAEKGRFSRWGPYVNHIGLIIILIAAILRTTPLMHTEEYVWVREGQQIVLPGTNGEYYIENKEFIMEVHDENDERFAQAIQQEGVVPSNFQTDIVIYQETNASVPGAEPELEPILEESIQMNKPAKFDRYTLYQSGYQVNEFTNMTFKVHETDDPEESSLGSFTIDLTNPDSIYELDSGFRVQVDQYYPDYILDNGIPTSETNFPRNPAFVLSVYPPESDTPEISFIGIGKNIDATGENEYKVGIEDFELHDVSGLTLRVDFTLPFFILGAAIFMIGVIQGMYWQHRRIWIHPKENGILLAAHTNKNWFGIKKDIEKSIENTPITMARDQQELDE
ncbi:cytochrome c biogenesis protein ResB [Oceanobacillus profundus]|uniref:Cytochrome c biogenesis protein ResB n=1 Tax=Oceanobacillus profundus TaxID=372463 RepID=A0A417YFS3_9BACI|nr:cytochrome c biogenesis protein ResB [Oceanobacillus profundus]MBR3120743.1 cytochrome c biogenesis protein ResB [Oceanobacillus sp.]MCM3396589.1 cytochrome c biogenesis protein ResB [Oceanobacillus profundus]PAE29823.1 cytochrome C biogenesis protein [Paenibacillus sp. 7884-2]RHW31547.1 cytochrome c biogenesis protein ResB [Oceanobacillus profundus]